MKYIVILFYFLSYSVFAQSKKAELYLEKAEIAYAEKNWKTAEEFFIKALVENPELPMVHFKLGKIASTNRQEDKAMRFFYQAIEKNPLSSDLKEAYQYVAIRELRNGEYEKALEKFRFVKLHTAATSFLYSSLIKYIDECEFGMRSIASADSIKKSKLPDFINCKKKQYFPVLTADNQQLIFTAVEENGDENLYVVKKEKDNWSKPQVIESPISTAKNEGTCTISADGRTMVFTSCDGRESIGGCDLYITYKKGDNWTEPINMGLSVNSKFWDSQPSLSADGSILFFSSERPNGIGKKDLWVSQKNKQNEWSTAINLGKNINTVNDDLGPFLHANGKTLFFSSNGHKGLGGYDLFFSELKNGFLSAPQNVGFPINTNKDQVSIFISADGSVAYYAQDDNTRVDLYAFEVPEKLKENYSKTSVVKGIITDAKQHTPIKARIELVDLVTQKNVSTSYSDETTGEYLFVIPHGSRYAINISKEGYLFNSQSFEIVSNESSAEKSIPVSLQKIEKNVDIILNNIFFDTGKWDIREESFYELNKVVDILKNNVELVVEFSGHTDDIGNTAENQLLSEKRALSVVHYLEEKGIDKNRLIARGFGELKPLLVNNSEQNRQQNRRIEMKIK